MLKDNEDVKPDETEESSVSVIKDDESKATDSSVDASAVDEGSQSTETEKLPSREALIAQLTGKTKKDAEVEDDESETEEDDSSKEPEVEETLAEETEEEAEPAITDKDIESPLGKEGSPGARKRIQHLLKQRKERDDKIAELEPVAKFGQSMLEVAAEAKLEPEALGAWLALAVEVNADPDKAAQRFYAEAERLAKARGTSLPKTVETVIPAEIEAIEEMLIADLAEGNIPGDVMKRYLEKIRAAKKAGAVKPTPPPVQVIQPVVQQATLPTPMDPAKDPAVVKAAGEIRAVQVELSKKHPADWPKIAEIVSKRISRYAGTNPTQWAKFYREEAEKVLKDNSTPVKKTPSTTIRPTSTTSEKPASLGKSAALAELMGRRK